MPPLAGGHGALIGRARELAWIDERLAGRSSIWLVGAAGIGKSALLRWAIDRAREQDRTVLIAAPSEAEGRLAYGVVADLVEGLPIGVREGLPGPQRAVLSWLTLDRALERPPDLRVLATSLRSAIDRAGHERPVLLVIDDAMWVDPESAAVLTVALRRTRDATLAIASRTSAGVRPGLRPADAAARLDVGGLSAVEIHDLIRARLGRPLPRPTMLRIAELSGGNPYFALQLAARLGAEETPAEIDDLEDLLRRRIAGLPAATRLALGRLALDDLPANNSRRHARSTEDARAIEAAVAEGIVERRGNRWRFTHPLMAEAAEHALAPDDRIRIHRSLARAHRGSEPGLRHLAQATVRPSLPLSARLAEAGEAALGESRALAAADLLGHAARLTPSDRRELVSERRLGEGTAWILAGDPSRGRQLLAEHLDHVRPGPRRGQALLFLAFGRAKADARDAVPLLERAVEEAADPAARREAIEALAGAVDVVGNGERATRLTAEQLAVAEGLGDARLLMQALAMRASRETFRDRSAWPFIERWHELRASLPDGGSDEPFLPRHFVSFALMRDGRIDEALAALDAERPDQMSVFHEAGHLNLQAILELAAGRLEEAERHADEAIAIGEQDDVLATRLEGLATGAAAASIAGESDRALAKARRILETAALVHVVQSTWDGSLVLGLDALGRDQLEEAADHFRRLAPEAWQRWNPVAGGRANLDAVDALTRHGTGGVADDLDLARSIARRVPDDAPERPVVDALLHSARGDLEAALSRLGATTSDDSATLAVTALPRAPFRAAQQQLILGRLLRRARRRSAARAILENAAARFAAIGATTWRLRAGDELARLGGRRSSGSRLTASEQRVAELAASGRPNKEIAAALGIAVRTVEAHLSRVFEKLDIESRAVLAARWPSVEAQLTGPSDATNIVDFRSRQAPSESARFRQHG